MEEPINRLWIINRGILHWSELASNHKEMHIHHMAPSHTTAAGEWLKNTWVNTICFFGNGEDFDSISVDDFRKAIQKSKFFTLHHGFKIKFSTSLGPEEAMETGTLIYPINDPVSKKIGAFWNK